ncbi:MAG: acyl carrier protein [Candidatus Omnitrophica bacterium]|nr:acyl carrier protein [Candidatus Omnitrophota bacterium]
MVLFDEVKEILAGQVSIKPQLIKPESKLTEDLGADSMDALEIVHSLEERFGIDIKDEEAAKITTVSEAVVLVEQKLQEKTAA